MRLHHTLHAVTVAVGLFAGSAHAESCNLLVDEAGDGVPGLISFAAGLVEDRDEAPISSRFSQPVLDLISGDVASGQTTVVAAARLAGTEFAVEPLRQLQPGWGLAFEIGSSHYAFSLEYDGDIFGTWRASMSGPAGTSRAVSWSFAGDTITWTAPRSAFPELAGPGHATFHNLAAISYLAGGSVDSMLGFEATYVDRRPSCLAAA